MGYSHFHTCTECGTESARCECDDYTPDWVCSQACADKANEGYPAPPIPSYTDGPWQVVSETEILAHADTPEAVIVADTRLSNRPATDEDLANARLMAASPDLLMACKDTLDWLATYYPCADEVSRTVANTLRNAIHKAEHGEWRIT